MLAAYNAGPGAANQWIKPGASGEAAIDAVESIDYKETRGYVKNVLAYDAYYRYFMGQKDTLMSDAEWQRRY